jgi:PAS domain S-box-containing protein
MLGRRLRGGYVIVLCIVAGGMIAAGFQVRHVLGTTAQHQRIVATAGLQGTLALRAADFTEKLIRDPTPQASAEFDHAMAAWSRNLTALETDLDAACAARADICRGFEALRREQSRQQTRLREGAATWSRAALEAMSGTLDADAVAYSEACERWTAALSQLLTADTLAQQERLWVRSLLLALGAALVVIVALEPTIRRLQAERATVDRWTADREQVATEAQRMHHLGAERLRQITDRVPASISYYDTNLICRFANRAHREQFGIAPETMVGQSGAAIFGDEWMERYRPYVDGVFAGELQRFEISHPAPDGSERILHVELVPEWTDGAVAGYLAFGTDVTRDKQAANALQAAKDEAEAASKAKGAFLANMSHEIRTPLHGAIGMTGLLLQTQLTAEQRQYAEIARSSGESLLSLINDILDLSKIESGQLELERIDFDLRAVIDGTIDAVALKANEKALELIVDIDPAIPTWLRGDPTRLRQILLNLISNAVKFTDVGEVSLTVNATTSDPVQPVALSFAVKDTGVGISAEGLAKLFKPFTQADASTTRRHGGTGLGLSICSRLVGAMGGDIHVDSTPDAGSTFRFQLEFERSERVAEPVEPALSAGFRMLLIDDHPIHLRAMAATLQRWNINVTTARTLADGLESWKAIAAVRPPDVVIVNHRPPDFDAVSLTSRIRELDPASQSHLVVLGSLVQQFSAEDANAFDRVLAKPLKSDAIQKLLTELVKAADRTLSVAGQPVLSPLAGRHVLLVDDNTVNQMLGQRQLARLGIHVTVAANGVEAIRHLRTSRFDAVLMDCQMPEMDGYEATRLLRRSDSGTLDPDVPVVALTANAMSGDRERCLDAGMNDFLTKPMDATRLPIVLAAVMRAAPPSPPLARAGQRAQ